MTTEIEKQKTVITKKYGKMKEVNKQKKVHAHNKRVAGDAACTAAQKAKDPAEKKKQRTPALDNPPLQAVPWMDRDQRVVQTARPRKGEKTGKKYQLGDKTRVMLIKADQVKRRLDFQILT